jgi:hypothetical protein
VVDDSNRRGGFLYQCALENKIYWVGDYLLSKGLLFSIDIRFWFTQNYFCRLYVKWVRASTSNWKPEDLISQKIFITKSFEKRPLHLLRLVVHLALNLSWRCCSSREYAKIWQVNS